MDKEEKIKYWLDLAEYDLITAKAMLKAKRYLYVGFICHQVIEKALKAYYVYYKSEIPPFTHNLPYLANTTDIYTALSEENQDFLDELLPLNIEARYPTYKEEILKKLDDSYSKYLINKTEKLFKWIMKKLQIK